MAVSPKTYPGIDNPEEQKWIELRSLLGGDQGDVAELREKFLNNENFAREIIRNLPYALRLAHERNIELSQEIVDALQPFLIKSLADSARTNPDELSEKLLPVLTPVARRALNDTFRRMDQNFNTLLLRTFSIKGIQLRIQAWRTGQKFTELMLNETLVYRVREVFLIHRETGLLLNHVVDESSAKDADMMSAMLKAIQDFVTDSFAENESSDLGSIQFGEQTILLERSRSLIMAAVIIGRPTSQLRDLMVDVLTRIDLRFSELLIDFDGDTEPFEQTQDDLKECLVSRQKDDEGLSFGRIFPVFFVLLALFLLWFIPRSIESYRWSRYLSFLSEDSSVVILQEGRRNGKLYAVGMLAPSSPQPELFYKQFGIDSTHVDAHWLYYKAYSPQDVLKKVERILKPPTGVSLKLRSDTLFVIGQANHIWIREAQEKIKEIWEVDYLALDQLIRIEVENPHKIAQRIEQMHIRFNLENSSLSPSQLDLAKELVRELQDLIDVAYLEKMDIKITVNGYADGTGSRSFNQKLSEERAQTVYQFLIAHGISPTLINTIGHGFTETFNSTEVMNNPKLRLVKLTIQISDK